MIRAQNNHVASTLQKYYSSATNKPSSKDVGVVTGMHWYTSECHETKCKGYIVRMKENVQSLYHRRHKLS